MLFPRTQRHYAICSLRELPAVARRDPGFWNVVSVLEASASSIPREGLLQIHRMATGDVGEGESVHTPSLEEVFRFADQVFGEPLLIHCMFGESRSPAVALLLMMRDMKLDGFPAAECAMEGRKFLLDLRPQAKPNGLILGAGLSLLFDETERAAVRDAWRSS